MGENPKGPSAPSQFHHKYPDRASGAELIVQAPAAAPPETALPAVGGRRPRQEAPPKVPQAHACARTCCPDPRHHFGAELGSGDWLSPAWMEMTGRESHLNQSLAPTMASPCVGLHLGPFKFSTSVRSLVPYLQ